MGKFYGLFYSDVACPYRSFIYVQIKVISRRVQGYESELQVDADFLCIKKAGANVL